MVQFLQQDIYPLEFALHHKLAQTDLLLELNWTHSLIVTEIALSLYDSGLFDTSAMERGIVAKAGLLFDIGVYVCGGFEWIPGQFPSEKPYVMHSVCGAEILHQEGYAEDIVQTALTHEGVGLTPEDIKTYGLQLPDNDYIPKTPTQWLICYSAKFHSKTPKLKTVADIEAGLERYGVEKLERFHQLQQSFGIPNIAAFQEKYQAWHMSFAGKMKQIQEGSVGGSAITTPVDLNPAGIATVGPIASPTTTPSIPVQPPATQTTPPDIENLPTAAQPAAVTTPPAATSTPTAQEITLPPTTV